MHGTSIKIAIFTLVDFQYRKDSRVVIGLSAMTYSDIYHIPGHRILVEKCIRIPEGEKASRSWLYPLKCLRAYLQQFLSTGADGHRSAVNSIHLLRGEESAIREQA